MKTLSEVQEYYDSTVNSRIAEFIDGNPRIEAAWRVVQQWTHGTPQNVLEIGCGVGDICWRMSLCWPEAKVVGLDVSPKELSTARTLFGSERVTFVEGPLTDSIFTQKFDLIVLMDVYEHILPADREALHTALRSLLSSSCRVILSFPTPRHQEWLKRHEPHLIQPVDEDIFPENILSLVRDLGLELLYYQDGGVWHKGDYAYAVIGKRQGWVPVEDLSARKKIRRLLGNSVKKLTGRKHLIRGEVKLGNFRVPPRSRRLALVRRKLDGFSVSEKS